MLFRSNLVRQPHVPLDDFIAREEAIHDLVHGLVQAAGGSISAEHGVGQAKRDALPRYKSAIELSLMARIKVALDPHALLNPGKVLPTHLHS